jgi:hypothetical protein
VCGGDAPQVCLTRATLLPHLAASSKGNRVPKNGGDAGGGAPRRWAYAGGGGPRRWGSGIRRWGFAVVRGRSMQPTLRDGDRLLVRYGAKPQAGRVVVVRLPDRPALSVKRIGWSDPGGWWIERDNPAEGVDSWQVGPVTSEAVVAVALIRVWPKPRLFTRSRGGRPGGRETPAAPQ